MELVFNKGTHVLLGGLGVGDLQSLVGRQPPGAAAAAAARAVRVAGGVHAPPPPARAHPPPRRATLPPAPFSRRPLARFGDARALVAPSLQQ